MKPEHIWLWSQNLRNKSCEIVTEFGNPLEDLVDRMIFTMKSHNGIGLAAPQIGVFKRLAVVHTLDDDPPRNVMVLCNPCVIYCEGEQEGTEGCLSIPGNNTRAKVKRWNRVKVAYQNINGKQLEVQGEGLLARALLHEIDHLEGKFFVDHLAPVRREMVIRNFRKTVNRLDSGKFVSPRLGFQ